jgi:hypothetical protein
MYKFIFSVLIFAVASSVAFAQEDDADANTPGPAKCAKLQASTVFIPDKAGSRQKGSASKLTESHRNAESQGWNFDEMSVYIEDGDLQGFFVTYTREHPCNRK